MLHLRLQGPRAWRRDAQGYQEDEGGQRAGEGGWGVLRLRQPAGAAAGVPRAPSFAWREKEQPKRRRALPFHLSCDFPRNVHAF